MTDFTFSIIIPCRSINNFLRENITHLKVLNYKNFEVLIVLDKLEPFDFEGDERFRMLCSGPVGPGAKRNFGSKEARGDVLVFLDDDAYPHPQWLNNALDVLEDTGIYALGAPALTPPEAPFFERVSGKVLESVFTSAGTLYRHIPKNRRYIDDYPTVNLFVRKDLFLKIGGFDENFWPGEDTKLCLDMIKSTGEMFLYDPEPIVYHHRRPLFLPHLKQISRYGRHRGQFAKIFPETSRKFAYFVPSLFTLGLLFGPILSLFFRPVWPFYLSVLWLYIFILLVEGIRVTYKEKNILATLYFMQGVFLTHIIYGINFIIGFIKRPQLELRDVDKKTGTYLGG